MKFEIFSLTFFKNDDKIVENTYKNLSLEKNSIRLNLFDYDTKFDIENKIFTRENEEFIFKLDILNQGCTIYLKKENLTVDINIDSAEMKIDKEEIILEYMIETDDQKNKIIIRNIGDNNE